MFCKHCGKEVADGALFCASCGQPVQASNPPTPQPQMPPILKSFLDLLKGLMNPEQGIGLAAKCTDYAGAIGIGLYYFIYVFARSVEAYQDGLGRIVTFGGMFGISCAMGAIYLVLMLIAFYGVMSYAANKPANPFVCLNVFGIALIPATVAMILNFGFGFVWDPLASFLTTIGNLFLYLVLYFSLGHMGEKPARNPFWVYCVAIAFAVVLSAFINGEIYAAYLF